MYDVPANPYLEHEVMTASPAKLRWMLIHKAVQLSRITVQLGQEKDWTSGGQWCLRLRDVLNELLAGVHGTDPLAKRVSDLYVFMLQQLTLAEKERNSHHLSQLQGLLEIEEETWRQLYQKLDGRADEGSELSTTPTASVRAAVAPPLSGYSNYSGSSDGSLCIDA